MPSRLILPPTIPLIKSKQSLVIANNGLSQVDTTITSVDQNNSLLRMLGKSGQNASVEVLRQYSFRYSFTSNTNVRLECASGPTNIVTEAVDVIEYYAGTFRSVQRGSITIAAGVSSNTATLGTTLTSLGKCELTLIGFTYDTAGSPQFYDFSPRLTLTNTTTITATRATGSTAGTIVANYQVAEYIA